MKKRGIAIILAALLLFPTLAFAAPSETEIPELRTENSRTFLLANGEYRTDIYGADIFYEKDGTLVEIDNTIVDAADESCVYTNAANAYSAKFRGISYDAVGLEQEDHAFTLTPLLQETAMLADGTEVMPLRACDMRERAVAVQDADAPLCEFEQTLLADDRTVWYPEVYPDVDYVYTALQDGLKEDIVIRSADAPAVYRFLLNTEGVKPVIEDGTLYLVDETAENQIFEMTTPYLEDAEGKSAGALQWEISQTDSGTLLELTADEAFMNAEDTVYPLATTSTFVTKGTSYTSDTYISSANATTNYVSNAYLRTGKDEPYGARRSYIRFKLPSGYKAAGVTKATLQLTRYSKGSATLHTKLYPCDGYWKSNQLVWDKTTNENRNNKTIYDNESACSLSSSGNDYTFNVTAAIQKCYNQEKSNYGFMLCDTNESDTDNWGTFYSSDASSNVPKLSVTHSGTEATDNYYTTKKWAGSAPFTFTGYTQDTSSYVKNAFTYWDGIHSDCNMGTLYSGSSSSNRKIRITNKTSEISNDVYGKTIHYNANGEAINSSGNYSYAVVELNKQSGSFFPGLHPDLKEEVVTHELGHALGLKHHNASTDYLTADSTCCIMHEKKFYCYAKPTSHDKKTLKALFNDSNVY